jgi:hypothetical protein
MNEVSFNGYLRAFEQTVNIMSYSEKEQRKLRIVKYEFKPM